MNIFESIVKVMSDIGSVEKAKKSEQGYMYRGIDQVLNALQPAMIKNRMFAIPEVLENSREIKNTKNGSSMILVIMKVKYAFYAEDGSHIDAIVIGEAMDTGDKASNKAMSVAYKYACFQVFSIPTEDIADPDNENFVLAPDPASIEEEQQKMIAEQEKIAHQKISVPKVLVIKGELKRTGVTEDAIIERYKEEGHAIAAIEDLTEELFIRTMQGLKITKDKG